MSVLKLWEDFGIFIITAITILLFALLTPLILTPANIANVLTSAAWVAIAAAGMTFAITAGGFDLSVGSTIAVTTCVLGKNIPIMGLWPAFILALLVGVGLGFTNGFIITKFKVQTFVATLATMIIYRGLALLYTGGRDAMLYQNEAIKIFTSGTLAFIPMPIFLMFFITIIAYIFYRFTPFGLNVRAIGSNKEASGISGIKVDRTIILIFIFTSVTTIISGTILTAQLLTGNGRLGKTFELQVITATILGGTSLSGGKGNIFGSMCAAIMLAIITNGLNLLGIPDFYQRLVTGIILIAALSIGGVSLIIKEKSR